MTKHQVYLSLGSNLGDKERNLRKAISLLQERVGPVRRQSSFLTTEPWGFDSANSFLNAAVLCESYLTPREVLEQIQKIEKEIGKRPEHATQRAVASERDNHCSTFRPPRYHDRPIDIDILLYDDLVVDEPDLKIPHPLMRKRDFVMIPLNEILTSK